MKSYKILESQKNCIILNHYFYHNPKLFHFIIKHFNNLQDINKNINDILSHCKIKNINKIKTIHQYLCNKEENYIEKNNIKIITLNDSIYPSLLKQITFPPVILFAKGNLNCLTIPKKIAIVGPRKPSEYGHKVCKYFSKELSNYFCIVSGLAEGIDKIAHQESITNQKHTIAILGTGLDRCYPSKNKILEQDLLKENGLLLSEIPLFSKPEKFHFPLRNRIISGICQGTLIIEAKEKSGSLITADFALEQNRDVFVIPQNIFQKESIGVNTLIKQGAKCTTAPKDIYEEYSISEQQKTNTLKTEQNNLNETEKLVLNCVSSAKHIDQILLETKISFNDVLQTLTFLEIKKYIKKTSSNSYISL